MREGEEEHPEPSITGAAFWALMDSWSVPDEAALRCIAGPPITRPGKRPRFRLVGDQVGTYQALRAIDGHLAALKERPSAWLVRSIAGQPFRRRKPVDFLAGGPGAVTETLHYLEREVFRASLRSMA